MNGACSSPSRRHERGEGQAKLIIFILGLALTGFAGSQYIPVSYNAASLKQEMQRLVDQATYAQTARNDPIGWVKTKMAETQETLKVPADAKVEVKKASEVAVRVTVSYTQPVDLLPFGLYTYPYEFNHTVTTDGLKTK